MERITLFNEMAREECRCRTRELEVWADFTTRTAGEAHMFAGELARRAAKEYGLGSFDRAELFVDMILEDPLLEAFGERRCGDVYLLKGCFLERARRYDEAIAYYQMANDRRVAGRTSSEFPESAATVALATAYGYSGRHLEAEAFWGDVAQSSAARGDLRAYTRAVSGKAAAMQFQGKVDDATALLACSIRTARDGKWKPKKDYGEQGECVKALEGYLAKAERIKAFFEASEGSPPAIGPEATKTPTPASERMDDVEVRAVFHNTCGVWPMPSPRSVDEAKWRIARYHAMKFETEASHDAVAHYAAIIDGEAAALHLDQIRRLVKVHKENLRKDEEAKKEKPRKEDNL